MRIGLIGIGMIAAVAGAGGAAGCTKVCSEVGCANQFTASIRSADGSFPSGTHLLEVLVDGVMQTCTFTFAETSPGIGRVAEWCSSAFAFTVDNDRTCTEIRTDQSVSQKCEPIPGQFIETIMLAGTPAQVHVWQYVDGAPILDAAAAPSYADAFPNGADCPPVCRQASASWTLQ
jgi:hypothetical protein